jgi:hypothetical protein
MFNVYNNELTAATWALNSAVECHLHTVEVIGSNPIAPTIFSTAYEPLSCSEFRVGRPNRLFSLTELSLPRS